MSLPCTLPYVCECPLGLSLVSYRTWLSFPSDLLHVGLPFILPYVSEFPHCHTVREWVSPVTYCTWVFPLSLCTLVNFHSILQCVSFPSVLLHVCKFPYWSTCVNFSVLLYVSFPIVLLHVMCDSPVSYRTWVSFPSDFGVAMINPSQFDRWRTGRLSSARYRGGVSAFSPVNMKDTFAVVPNKIKYAIC